MQSSSSNMACNPDMQGCIPQILQLLDQVHSGQQQLLQLWQIKKVKLEQCLQLRIFEQDCEKVKKGFFSFWSSILWFFDSCCHLLVKIKLKVVFLSVLSIMFPLRVLLDGRYYTPLSFWFFDHCHPLVKSAAHIASLKSHSYNLDILDVGIEIAWRLR